MKSNLHLRSFPFDNLFKRCLSITILLISTASVFAQTGSSALPPKPIPLRQVSGIVRDSIGETIIGATITLTSVADTLKTSSNEDGVFVFKGVKAWVFSLNVSSIGYVTKVIAGKYNDATARLTLNPIVLKPDSKILNEVIVNGAPSIVYKTDTVEYKASDYVVRKGATVDELIQKMEGFEVANDGSVTVNGTAITKARVNGKDIYGGDVATAVQNLPAEIVDKIQIVDDYGNTAARTGVKDGDPTKVLNITTRTDKSVGNMAKLNGGVGTIDQLEGSANLTRINKNQTITANTTYFKTPNGIAGGNSSVGRLGGASNRGGRSGGNSGGGASNASGGLNTRIQPAFTYRDSFGKKIQLLANYSFRYNNSNTLINSYSESFSTLGTTFISRDANNNGDSKAHTISFEIEYNIDSANFLQFKPDISLNSTGSNNTSSTFQNGLIHKDQFNLSNTSNTRPNFGGTLAYQHVWLKNKARSFSIEATIGQQKNNNGSEQNNNILYYQQNSDQILKDSIVHRYITTDNLRNSYRASVTYTEPLGALSRLEFNSNIEYRGYDNSKLTSNLDNVNNQTLIDSLSNIFEYAFTQYRNSLNFKYGSNTSKYGFSLGLTAVNTSLVGTKVSLGTNTDQKYFKLIPIARFQVRFSSTHKISLNYSGRANEPDFNQIQPVRDVSNPQNPIVGNPNLKVAFNHAVVGQYSNYIANAKFNYDLRVKSSITENQVSSNTVQIKDDFNTLKNETRYVNLNGNKSYNADYTLAKQLNNRKYSLSFTGNVENSTRVSMSNNEKNTAETWGFKESFGPRMNPTKWLEINPYVSFDFNKTNYSLPRSTDVLQKIWAISLDGNIYFLKNMQFGYAVSKNYVSGIGNNKTNNPFIINSMLQMKVLKNIASLQLRVYDLLNQNNFINRTQNENGFTETLTNPNSRYVMLNLSMNLQKWTGAAAKNGKSVIRRGDGSFMN
jgi:hypothetical protein